jgi:hypothetical protein
VGAYAPGSLLAGPLADALGAGSATVAVAGLLSPNRVGVTVEGLYDTEQQGWER